MGLLYPTPIDNTEAVPLGFLNKFIAEQGTSGIWTYRKWDSGLLELWGKPILDQFQDVRCIYKHETLPFSLVGTPVVNITLDGADDYLYMQGAIVFASKYISATNTLRMIMIKSDGGLVSGDFAEANVQIIGKWK